MRLLSNISFPRTTIVDCYQDIDERGLALIFVFLISVILTISDISVLFTKQSNDKRAGVDTDANGNAYGRGGTRTFID